MDNKEIWIIVHEHASGTSTHFFRSGIDSIYDLPCDRDLAGLLDIDFEPDDGETFDVS